MVARMAVEKCEPSRKLTVGKAKIQATVTSTRSFSYANDIGIPVLSQNVNLSFTLRRREKVSTEENTGREIYPGRTRVWRGKGKRREERKRERETRSSERRGIDDGYDDDEKRGTFEDR